MWNQQLALAKPRHPWMQSKSGAMMVLVSILLPLIGAMIGLFFSNSIPNPISTYLGLWFGALFSAWWVALVEVGYRSGVYRNVAASDRKYLKPWMRLPISLWVGFMFGYGAFAWGFPWVANSVIGTVSEEVVTVTGWEAGGFRSCSRPQIGRSLFVLSPKALCLSSHERDRVPPGTRLRLVGPATALGMNVENVYVIQ
jgi:hypothetical protein